MEHTMSAFQKARAAYQPVLPDVLRDHRVALRFEEASMTAGSPEAEQQIRRRFRHSIGAHRMRAVWFVTKGAEGESVRLKRGPLRVGVVLSGGQAPGGHNVIAGIWDALQRAHRGSKLYGFKNGPAGVIKGQYEGLTQEKVDLYRNSGGFHMIGTGRDKIEKPRQLKNCLNVLTRLRLDGLIIIGGDDSNTNAAILAEYLLKKGSRTRIIGVPKTIDGDLRNRWIGMSFGFDTATKTYAELVGNICLDCLSSGKYWYFIRLMGRSASHITLEVALQTHPNLAIISEEVKDKGQTLADVVREIVELVCRRAREKLTHGVVLVPEGLLEFLPDMKLLIKELDHLLKSHERQLKTLRHRSERCQFMGTRLSRKSAQVYRSLPEDIQEALLKRDSHGHIPLSQIETGRLIVELVAEQIAALKDKHQFKGDFRPLSSFFGYEGRSVAPSNFDADYTYALGRAAVQLIRAGLTGYTTSATGLAGPTKAWQMGGLPIAAMLIMEIRKDRPTPVIRRTLVDLKGKPFGEFDKAREDWKLKDDYISPGPIQYLGPPKLTDTRTRTLVLERG